MIRHLLVERNSLRLSREVSLPISLSPSLFFLFLLFWCVWFCVWNCLNKYTDLGLAALILTTLPVITSKINKRCFYIWWQRLPGLTNNVRFPHWTFWTKHYRWRCFYCVLPIFESPFAPRFQIPCSPPPTTIAHPFSPITRFSYPDLAVRPKNTRSNPDYVLVPPLQRDPPRNTWARFADRFIDRIENTPSLVARLQDFRQRFLTSPEVVDFEHLQLQPNTSSPDGPGDRIPFPKKNRYSSGYLHPTHLHPTTRRRTVSPPPETARIAGGTPSLPIQSTRNPDEYYTADRRNQSAPFILPPSTDTGRTHKRFFSFLRSNSSKSFLRNRAYSTHPPKKSFKFYRQISCITQTQFPTLCYANWWTYLNYRCWCHRRRITSRGIFPPIACKRANYSLKWTRNYDYCPDYFGNHSSSTS